MGPRAGLDKCGKSHTHRDSSPGPSSSSPLAVPIELPGCREQNGTELIQGVPETGLEVGSVDIPTVCVYDDNDDIHVSRSHDEVYFSAEVVCSRCHFYCAKAAITCFNSR